MLLVQVREQGCTVNETLARCEETWDLSGEGVEYLSGSSSGS